MQSLIFHSKHNQTYKLLLCASILCTILAICCSYILDNQYNYIILPLSFIFLIITLKKRVKQNIGKLPGITTLFVILFVRYCILPFFLYKTGELSIYAHDYNYIGNAILLMTYELFCIICAVNYGYSDLNSNTINNITYQIKEKKYILIISLLLLTILILTNPNIVGGISLITQGYIDDVASDSEGSSFSKVLWTIVSTFAYVYSIYIVSHSKYKYNKNKIFICVILTFIFVILTYISQERISRWYTLVCALSSIFYLRKLFPLKGRQLTGYIIIPVMALMISATIFKNFIESKVTGESEDKMLITTLDAYVAGPVSVNNAISLNENKNFGIETFFADLTNNMPVVNHFINRDKSSVYQYNAYLGRTFDNDSRGDQIIPMIGQGSIYLGYFLAPLIEMLYVFVIAFFDKKYLKSTSYFVYLNAFCATWFAIAIILNITINLSWIYIRILPMYILFILMKKL